MSDVSETLTGAGELLLDPFAFHLNEKSAIAGLGGHLKPADPAYALHTDYVRVAEGPAAFTLRFQGLAAKLGTLMLRVHILVDGPPPRCLVANTVRIQFNRLIQLGSEISVRFEGIRGVRFALYGGVLGECDAAATGLTATLDRPALDEEQEAEVAPADLRATEFGLGATRAVPLLVSVAAPTLASPVSQVATAAQLREPAFAEWRERMRVGAGGERAAWSAAYVLQAMRVYGLLQEGVRGLGFGTDAAAVATAARAFGMAAEIATLPDDPASGSPALKEFDVLWSIDATAVEGVGHAHEHVIGLIRHLRPGGLAIHVVPFLPGRQQRRPDGPTVAFRRGEVERLALAMIGRGAEAAQLKIDGDAPLFGDTATGLADVGAFGLIFRKAPLASS